MGENWIAAADVSSIDENDAVAVTINSMEIAIFRSNGNFYATDNYCTHGRAPLSDGYLDGEIIECPLHQGCFNLRTGKAMCSPVTRDINTYPVKIINGVIQVCI